MITIWEGDTDSNDDKLKAENGTRHSVKVFGSSGAGTLEYMVLCAAAAKIDATLIQGNNGVEDEVFGQIGARIADTDAETMVFNIASDNYTSLRYNVPIPLSRLWWRFRPPPTSMWPPNCTIAISPGKTTRSPPSAPTSQPEPLERLQGHLPLCNPILAHLPPHHSQTTALHLQTHHASSPVPRWLCIGLFIHLQTLSLWKPYLSLFLQGLIYQVTLAVLMIFAWFYRRLEAYHLPQRPDK